MLRTSEGGFRLYSEADVTRLLMRLLEALGTGSDEAPDVDRLSELEQVIARAEERRETLRRQVEMADEFIETLRGPPAVTPPADEGHSWEGQAGHGSSGGGLELPRSTGPSTPWPGTHGRAGPWGSD